MKIQQKKETLPRSAGVLLHPTSLYTKYGIGDFGPQAFKFIDYLKKCGQSFWQILPLGPTGYADSPYQCLSAFAGNLQLISPDLLIDMYLISADEVKQVFKDKYEKKKNNSVNGRGINYDLTRDRKFKILEIAFKCFSHQNYEKKKEYLAEFQDFCHREALWLEDFVLFYSLKKQHKLQSWVNWPSKYTQKNRSTKPFQIWVRDHADELEFYRFIQWIFSLQWQKLRTYANKKGIQIIGDMPIFVAHDSVDVWAHQELFTLNNDGSLKFQAGVPPDYFSSTGQLWGNPLYRWNIIKENKFEWFISRFEKLKEMYDWIRVDHFRGFEACWKIDGNEDTAINGKWDKVPGKELFQELKKNLGNMSIIAEDLGVITPEVEELRDFFNFPGMKVLQFAFGGGANNPHLSHNIKQNSIVYSGTHDNDTTLGWWQNDATFEEKEKFKIYFDVKGEDIIEEMFKALYRTVAKLAIIPIQDLLKQGSIARMNTPSVAQGNWQYQLKENDLSEERATWINNLAKLYGRCPLNLEKIN